MIKYYLQLQSKRLLRKMQELGIHPLLAALLGLLLFIAMSAFLYYKSDHAQLIYPCLAAWIAIRYNASLRAIPMYQIFNERDLRVISMWQSLVILAPFILFLLYKGAYLISLILLVMSPLITYLPTARISTKPLPTPFKKLPFEFTAGFRRSIFLLVAIFLLAVKAMHIGNYNLAATCVLLTAVIGMAYYTTPEALFFVWIFECNSRTFIGKKLVSGIKSLLIMEMPLVLALLFIFPERVIHTLIVLLGSCLLLCTMILAKYSAYPYELNLPQAVLLAICVWFPPMLLAVIPIFFMQSIKKLQNTLS